MNDPTTTIQDFAERVVRTESLAEKLEPPAPGLSDAERGAALRLDAPGRPRSLRIVASARVPSIEGMADPAQRVRILHGFANHELQAVELFAWALLAFPDAPASFRRGLLRILADWRRRIRASLPEWEPAGE